MGPGSYRLIVRSGQGEGKPIQLPAEGVLRAGSNRACQIVLTAPGVLPVHFFVKCLKGRAALLVQDDAARVAVNGVEVRKKVLEAGDTIQAGEATLAVEAVERDPFLGETVGGYRIDALIGRGAMGTVYKATQLSLERTVALKILSPDLTKDSAFVGKFLEEARAAARLNHPNVVQVYDAAAVPSPAKRDGQGAERETGSDSQVYFFSMEYMPGGTLQDVIDRDGKMPLPRALAIACDAARALVWAEEHGMVHRDIKPANLLFAADGAVKVADLGIAGDPDRMMEGVDGLQGAGSPRYMAPEQALKRGVDSRADIYALGSTLFRSISGQHAFDGKSATEVLKAKTTQDAPRLDAIEPEIPTAVADLVARMLSREVSGRPQSCAATLAALEECLEVAQEEAADAEAEPDAPAESAAGPSASRRNGRRRRGRSQSPWAEFIQSTPGRLNLSVSSLMVFCAVVWAATYTPPPPPASTPPAVVTVEPEAKPIAPRKERAVEPEPEKVDVKTAPPPLATAGTDPVIKELATLLQEWRSGLIEDPRRAIAALEDFKKRHPQKDYVDKANEYQGQIRTKMEDLGREAVSRLVKGDVQGLLEKRQFREAISRLVKLGDKHPFSLKEVQEEVKNVEEAARGVLKLAASEADKAVAAGDFEGGKSIINDLEPILPPAVQPDAKAKIDAIARVEKEYVELSSSFSRHTDGVQEAISALDFDRAASLASAMPQPQHPLLARRRAALVSDVDRCRKAWDGLQAAAAGGGSPATPALLARPVKDLLSMLGQEGTHADKVEGLGLLLLYTKGPHAARELLLGSLLGAEKVAQYKLRLAEEEEAFLSRLVRRSEGKASQLDAAGEGKAGEAATLAAELERALPLVRSSRGYAGVKASLAKAYMRARVEVLKASLPASLFSGTVKSYKPDGSIEIYYDFSSTDGFKDFVPAKFLSSRFELEGKTAKMRGEFRLARGDVFRNRLAVTLRLPRGGYSSQAPNINVALWTRDEDAVTSVQRRAGALTEEDATAAKTAEGPADDYFAFGIGYRARSPSLPGDSLSLRGSTAQIQMPANVMLGGIRGEPLHALPAEDCFWAVNVQGKVNGSQEIKVAMASGVPTLSINKRTIPAREVKGLEVMKRPEPFMGSVTLFTNGEVLYFESISIEGELNPAWVETRLLTLAEAELKKVEPEYPFGK